MSTTLGWVDYIVWSILLVLSLGIGFYFGFIDSRKKRKSRRVSETSEFLLGGRKMGAIPVACSLMASFFSAITLLGTPNEIYQNGLMYWFIGIAYSITIIISIFLFVPVFYNLQITSSYQYLAVRFSKTNQILGAVAFIIQMTPYMGIALYGPSLALKLVINVNMWYVVVAMIVICTIYTTIGGLKAVVWTDVLQLMMMFLGMTAIIVKGCMESGGFGNAMKTAREQERLQLDFSADPRVRHSFWALVIGGTFLWCGNYAINQTMIQRAISVKSLGQAKLSYLYNVPGMNLLLMIVTLCGLFIFHVFNGCDPLLSGHIKKTDELVPYFVSKYLLQYPGIGGIFVAGIFSGSLSTMSSGLNSLAAVTLNDIFMLKYERIEDSAATKISKFLVVSYGIFTLLFAYIASLASKILEMALGLFGMLSGPSLGVFTLGMFFPFANAKGAISGHIISQLIVLWIGFGSYYYNIKHPRLSLSNFNCTGEGNFSRSTEHFITSNNFTIKGIENLYAISYLWYGVIGWVMVMIIGIPVSLITRSDKDKKVYANLISPPVQKFWQKYILDDEVTAVENSNYLENRNKTIQKLMEKDCEISEL